MNTLLMRPSPALPLPRKPPPASRKRRNHPAQETSPLRLALPPSLSKNRPTRSLLQTSEWCFIKEDAYWNNPKGHKLWERLWLSEQHLFLTVHVQVKVISTLAVSLLKASVGITALSLFFSKTLHGKNTQNGPFCWSSTCNAFLQAAFLDGHFSLISVPSDLTYNNICRILCSGWWKRSYATQTYGGLF